MKKKILSFDSRLKQQQTNQTNLKIENPKINIFLFCFSMVVHDCRSYINFVSSEQKKKECLPTLHLVGEIKKKKRKITSGCFLMSEVEKCYHLKSILT